MQPCRTDRSSWNEVNCFDKLTPLPSSATSQSATSMQGVHILAVSHPPTRRAGEGHWGCQPNGSSCLDALALLSYSLATPQSLLPFYSLLRFQFQWRLTVACVVFKIFFSTEISRRNREIQEIQSTKLETVCLESTKNYSVELMKRTSGTTTTYCLSHCDFT